MNVSGVVCNKRDSGYIVKETMKRIRVLHTLDFLRVVVVSGSSGL